MIVSGGGLTLLRRTPLLNLQTARSIFLSGLRKAKESSHDSGHGGHGEKGHKHDPQEHWYEAPMHVQVFRNSRLKLPWYIKEPKTAYRAPPPSESNSLTFQGIILSGIMWWWIFWNTFMDPGHVIGEYGWPHRKEWTDEELGIPSLDA